MVLETKHKLLTGVRYMQKKNLKETARQILQQFFFLPDVNSEGIYFVKSKDKDGKPAGLNLIVGADGDIYIKTQGNFFISTKDLSEKGKWYRTGCILILLSEAIELDSVRRTKFKMHDSDDIQIYDNLKLLLKNPIKNLESLSGEMYGVVHDDCDGDHSQTLNLSFEKNGISISTNNMFALRFRMPFIGGGMYPRIHTALRILCFAIYLDTYENEKRIKKKVKKQKATQ